jgi:hypothetical protein
MKSRFFPVIFTFLALFSFSRFYSQSNGLDIRQRALVSVDGLNLENKILFINVWKSDNAVSRENNKEFTRVSRIYEQAKLKNGLKGVTYLNISLDDPMLWRISLKKDSIETKYSLENSTGKYASLLQIFNNQPGNIVIGSDGDVLGTNIKKEDCFILFRSLITR